jgi:3-deoxy-D-manno-octulosonate 8-phosphate phosphatase (KDO 8-P phosphatase)
MTTPVLPELSADLRARAARVRLLALDVDGTLTDGRITLASDGTELKSFSVLDGQGLSLLLRSGIEVALITARSSPVVDLRARELGITHVHQGSRDKRSTLGALCATLSLDLADVAFMGDDLPDLRVLTIVGLAVAPRNAHPWVRERVHWCTAAAGGDGAVRELCDALLLAQDRVDAMLAGSLQA